MSEGRPRALLVQPPIYDFALFDLFHQPFGLMRIASWLDRSGYEVKLLDCLDTDDPHHPAGQPPRRRNGTGKFLRQVVDTPSALRSIHRRYARYGISAATVEDRIRDAKPDVVLIETGMTYWYQGCQEIANVVRSLFPNVPVVAGGVYATLLPRHCSEHLETDLVVQGSADPSLGAFLARVGLPEPVPPLPYQPDPGSNRGSRLREAGVLRLNEGCPFSCDYCASHLLRPQFTAGDAESLLESLASMHRAGISHFAFYDDALLHRSELAFVPFLEQVIRRFGRRSLSFHVPNAVHAKEITPVIAELMFAAGFREVRLGIESDDPLFHRTHGNKIDVDRLRQCVLSLKRAGFVGNQITGYLLAGIPGTTARDFAHSLETVESLGLHISIAEYSPVPGTRLFDAACEQSSFPLADEPLCHNNSILPTASPDFTAQDLSEIRARVTRHNRGL